jgi:hypothetical protein
MPCRVIRKLAAKREIRANNPTLDCNFPESSASELIRCYGVVHSGFHPLIVQTAIASLSGKQANMACFFNRAGRAAPGLARCGRSNPTRC